MTDTPISTYIIGGILFTFILVGGVAYVSSFAVTDTSDLKQFNKTFNKYDQVLAYSNDTRDSIKLSDPDPGVLGFLNALIQTSWNTLKLTFTSISFIGDAITGISEFFPVPTWIPALILAIITIIIAFAIYAAIFQRGV